MPDNSKMTKRGVDDSNAWVVAWASFFVKVLSHGMINTRGLFFLATISQFKTDRQQASIPFAICVCIRTGVGPLVSFFGNRYGLREVTLLGCIGSSIAVAACYFAKSVDVLTAFWGVALGVFFGFSNCLVPVILNEHFDKYRVMANGLHSSGASFGLLVLSPLIDFLIGTYGLSGTFLIVAAVMLNNVPAALIMLYKQHDDLVIRKTQTPNTETLNNGTSTTSLKLEPLPEGCPLSNKKCSTSQADNSIIGGDPIVDDGGKDDFSEIEAPKSLNIEPFDKIQIELCGICKRACLHCECNTTAVEIEPDTTSGLLSHTYSTTRGNSIADNGFKESFSEIESPKRLDIEPFDQVQIELCGICQSASLHCECNSTTVDEEPDATSGLLSHSVGEMVTLIQLASSTGDAKHQFQVKKQGKNSPGFLRQNIIGDTKISGSPETVAFINVSEPQQENESNVFVGFKNNKRRKYPVNYSISEKKRHKFNKEKTGLCYFLAQSDIVNLICDWKFLIFATGGANCGFMIATFLLIIADFAIDIGVHPSNAKYLIMWISVVDIFGRMCLGWITDKGYITKKNFMGLCFACACISNLVTVWSSEIVVFLISITLFELAQCGILINIPPVMAEFIKKDLQTAAISSSFVLSAPLVFVISPMIGFFRDGMKSYSGIFYVLGALNFACASLFLFVPMKPLLKTHR